MIIRPLTGCMALILLMILTGLSDEGGFFQGVSGGVAHAESVRIPDGPSNAESLSDLLRRLKADDALKPKQGEQSKAPEPLPAPSKAGIAEKAARAGTEVEKRRAEKSRLHDAVTRHPRYQEFKGLMASQQRLREARNEVEAGCAGAAPSCQQDRQLLAEWEQRNEARRQEMKEVFGELVELHHQVSRRLERAENEHHILETFHSELLSAAGRNIPGCNEGTDESAHRCLQAVWDNAGLNSEGARKDLDVIAIRAQFETEKDRDFKGLICVAGAPGCQPGGLKIKDVPAPSPISGPGVGGVALAYDHPSFAQALQWAKTDPMAPADIQRQWDDLLLEDAPHETIGNLVGVSMTALVREASRYSTDWSSLPAELRHPGRMIRLRGMVLDPRTRNIVLIGERNPAADPAGLLSIDDLVVAFHAVLEKEATPAVSIDPVADDPTLPHQARVMGIPADSGFARDLLAADYAMKQILSESDPLNLPALTGTIRQENEAIRRMVGRNMPLIASRNWLFPVQPFPGSLLATSDGTTILFQNGVQVLTEEETLTQKGFSGKGKSLEPHRKIAMAFSRHYSEIARLRPVFHKTEGLFDLVYAATLLKAEKESLPWLAAFVSLPYQRVDVPAQYAPIVKDYAENNFRIRHVGGVHIPYPSRMTALMEANRLSLLELRREALKLSDSGAITKDLPEIPVQLAAIDYSQTDPFEAEFSKITQRMAQGNYAAMHETLDKLLVSNFDVPAWHLLKATAYLGQMRFDEAEKSARRARVLGAGDHTVTSSATVLLANTYAIQGWQERALQEVEAALQAIPDDPWLFMIQGEMLWALNRQSEGRQAFRKATALDPAFAKAYASQARLEAGEGFVFYAKRLARKAYMLDPDDRDIQADLALAEVSLRQLEDGEALAQAILEDPAAMPTPRFKSHMALAMAAGMRGNWPAMETHADAALDIFPGQVEVLATLAQLAETLGNPDLGQQYRNRIQRSKEQSHNQDR